VGERGRGRGRNRWEDGEGVKEREGKIHKKSSEN